MYFSFISTWSLLAHAQADEKHFLKSRTRTVYLPIYSCLDSGRWRFRPESKVRISDLKRENQFLSEEIWESTWLISRDIYKPGLKLDFTSLWELAFRVYSHAPSILSHWGTKVIWPDFQPMRVPEEPVWTDLFRQTPVFTSLHLKYPSLSEVNQCTERRHLTVELGGLLRGYTWMSFDNWRHI
jgi:hypothetical protein